MSFTKNNIELRGYVNYLKKHPYSDGFSFSFSITLSAGKDKDGEYRKEYFEVRLSPDASKSNNGKFDNGDFVQIEGRLRNVSYEKDGQKKRYSYVEAFDLFTLIRKVRAPQQAQLTQQPMNQPPQYQQPQGQPQAPQYQNHQLYRQPPPQYQQPQQGQPQAPQAPQAPELDGIPF